MIPYTLCSGLAGLVSLVSIGLKLRVFVGFVARMLGRVPAMLEHEQDLTDLKQQMAALGLVALFEDLPMGTPSLICRHVLRVADCGFCTQASLGHTSSTTPCGSASTRTQLVASHRWPR